MEEKQKRADPRREKQHPALKERETSPESVLQVDALGQPNPTDVLGDTLYRCIKYLSRGASGFVVLAEDKNKGKQHALKLMDVTFARNKYAEREILNHFKLKHPHIISLEEIFVTDNHLVLVMEFANQGDLFSLVKQKGGLKEAEALWFFQQLILAVDFCHRMGVVNRDIKPENILLASSSKDGKMFLKLCDFGFSKDTRYHSPPKTRLGTAMYIAPEVMRNLPHEKYDGCQSDIWSCGVVLYVMLTCKYPFLPDHDIQNPHTRAPSMGLKEIHSLFDRTLSNNFDRIPGVSKECNDLLARMLEPEPSKRATASDIMSSTWFNNNNLGKELDTFNSKVINKLQESPRVTYGTVHKVRDLLQGQRGRNQ